MVMLINSGDFSLDRSDRLFYQLLTVKGSFTVKNLFQVRRAMENLLQMDLKNVALDMEGCEEIDSSGIGLLTNVYKQLKTRGGVLAVAKCPPPIYGLLRDTGLTRVFLFFRDIEEVDAHFE